MQPLSRSGSQQDVSNYGPLEFIQRAFDAPVVACANPSQNTGENNGGVVPQPCLQLTNSNSLPYLPSTVPYSQADINVEPCLQRISQFVLVSGATVAKEMSSQGSLPQDTQPISQSIYEDIINKAKSVHGDREGFQDSVTGGVTQKTLTEGDDGHIDLVSSFQHQVEDLAHGFEAEPESDPTDLSPAQTQHRLPQFPESQRFKTPGTTTKKTNCLGRPNESKCLPRNPLARSGGQTPGKLMGLSQAFAATQAASSPLPDGLPSEPLSDRPSPKMDLQTRPATSSLSSPLRPLSGLRRTYTEPYTKYTSIKESQAERERLAEASRLAAQEIGNELSDDDDFGAEPSIVERRRIQREIDEEARLQFEAVSSPARPRSRGKLGGSSSPPRGPKFSSPRTDRRKTGHGYNRIPKKDNDNEIIDILLRGGMSEEETDMEDEPDIAVRRSSQTSMPAEEDKENVNSERIEIPATTIRLQQAINGFGQVEASPSIRRVANSMLRTQQVRDAVPEMISSPISAVANSQPSQPTHTNLQHQIRSLSSSDDGRYFVPQSQYVTIDSLASSHKVMQPSSASRIQAHTSDKKDLDMRSRGNTVVEDGCATTIKISNNIRDKVGPIIINKTGIIPLVPQGHDRVLDKVDILETMSFSVNPRRNSSHVAQAHESTIPESSPPARNVQAQQANARANANAAAETVLSHSKSSTHYETALSHPLTSSNGLSCPHPLPLFSILASPSGRKRRRMDEIAADTSPDDPISVLDMDAVIGTVKDKEFQDLIGGSNPIFADRNPKRRRVMRRSVPVNKRITAQENTTRDSPGKTRGALKEHENDAEFGWISQTIEQDKGTNTSSDGHVSGAPSLAVCTVSTDHIRLVAVASGAQRARNESRPGRRSEDIWDVQGSPPTTGVVQSRAQNAGHRKSASGQVTVGIEPGPHLLKLKDRRAVVTQPDAAINNPPNDKSPAPDAPSTSLKIPSSNLSAPPVGEVICPNQVFAFFNGKTSRAYYPATCLGVVSSDCLSYDIKWTGIPPQVVGAQGVRSLDLRVGDAVKVDLEGFPKVPHIIRGFRNKIDSSADIDIPLSDVRGYQTLLVAIKQRKTLPGNLAHSDSVLNEVPISAIYLDNNMWRQMKDREFTYTASRRSAAVLTHSGAVTPSKRPSTPSTPSSRTRRMTLPPAAIEPAPQTTSGMFSNMAFAISYEDCDHKDALTSLIKSNDGIVVQAGFHELFTASDDDSDLQLKPQFANLGFTALLSHSHSRMQKYMQALALNLPCLSGRWAEKCVERGDVLDWSPYLLPAGGSRALDGAVRSRILPASDAKDVRLQSMLAKRSVMLRTDGKGMLMVMGRGKTEERMRVYYFLIRASGASKIQKVIDLKGLAITLKEDAQSGGGATYDYVFVESAEVAAARATIAKMSKKIKDHTKVMETESLCQSLILGSLFEE